MGAWGCGTCQGENPDGTRFCGHCGAARSDQQASVDSLITRDLARRVREADGGSLDEHRLVTAVFADLSGFTGLAERLDTEGLQAVIDPVIAELAGVVAQYGGYVDKYAGDAVFAFFGAPVAHGDDAERALAAALEMRNSLEVLIPKLPSAAAHLSIHIGVSTGRGVARLFGHESRRDYSVLGEGVILAQRLESIAPSGEIYVGELTTQIARQRFEFEPLGRMPVKGRSEPVEVFRLLGERSRVRHDLALVARGHEVEQIHAAAGTIGVASRLIAIVGEAGAGKSRLVQEVLRTVPLRWLVLEGRSHAADIPYLPFHHALRELAGITNATKPAAAAMAIEDACERLGSSAAFPHVAALFGYGDASGDLEPEAQRRALHREVAAGVANTAASAGLAILLEDVHWFDPSTLQLVEAIVHNAGRGLLIIGTARPEGTPRFDVLGGDWDTLTLEPLGADDLTQLLDLELGGRPEQPLVDQVAARSRGNPLFALELAGHVSDRLIHRNGGWSLPDTDAFADVAPTIEGVLGARIDALPGIARRSLEVLAVLGPRARRSLAVAAGVDDETGIEPLIGERILLAEGGDVEYLAFAHPLLQEVAYRRLVSRERRALHLRVADIVEVLAPDDVIDLLAYHLERAEAGTRAVAALRAAAARARLLFANDEAAARLARAIELGAELDAGDAAALHVELGSVEELLGHYDSAHQSYGRGAESGLPGMAACLRKQGRTNEALAFAAAYTTGASGIVKTLLLLERGRTHLMVGDLSAASDAFERTLERVGDDRSLRAETLLGLALVRQWQSVGDRGHSEACAAFDLATGNALLTTKALRVRGAIEDSLGLDEQAKATLTEALGMAERTGDVQEIGACLHNLGQYQIKRDDLTGARVTFERGLSHLRGIGHSGFVGCQTTLADVLVRLGDIAPALSLLDEAAAAAEQVGDLMTLAEVLRIRARAAHAIGDWNAAGSLANEALSRFEKLDSIEDVEQMQAIIDAIAARAPLPV